MGQSAPRLSQFGSAFAWLLDKEVPSSRLAGLFDTTAENIRVIAFRARHENLPEGSQDGPFAEAAKAERAGVLGVRPGPDDVVRTPARTRQIEGLNSEIESTVAHHARKFEFLEGIRALRRLLPLIGYPGDYRRVGLLAKVRHQIAWFLVHSGQCESAAREARAARDLWRSAYHESPRREYTERFVQSALVGSQAELLARQPSAALRILDIARSAAESIEAPFGSDHFRQRGVALLQLREDQRAATEFRQSAEAMERLNEAETPAQVIMTGSRHIHLLGHVNWDGANELVAAASREFGADSLEASMALHWAVACAISTDSSPVVKEANGLIGAHPSPAPQFGHQLTIRKLLSITPELGLDARLRKAWARRALYENAFRAR